MRMRHRDLTQMMGCVQCDHCRVYGTVMCLGLGAMMQVLLGSSGRLIGRRDFNLLFVPSQSPQRDGRTTV